jgi:hypothetical protein
MVLGAPEMYGAYLINTTCDLDLGAPGRYDENPIGCHSEHWPYEAPLSRLIQGQLRIILRTS